MFVVVKHRVGNTLMNSSCDTNSELVLNCTTTVLK